MANEKMEFDFTEIFKDERMGFLSTIHKESGAIQQNAVSWIMATNLTCFVLQ